MSKDNTEYPSHLELLAELTDTEPEEWEATNGPDSGCGTDYYYHHPHTDKEAWINVDQDHVTVVVDGNTLFTGFPDQDKEEGA